MRTAASLMSVACVVASSAAVGAPKPPTGKWIVDFDDAQCVAMRDYGTKKKPLFLILKEPPMGDVMQVAVIQRGEGTNLAEQMHAVVTPDKGPSMRMTMVSAAASQTGNTLFRMNMTHDQFAKVAAARSVRIDADSDLDEAFELTDVPPLLRVLDRCVADLRQVWNVKDAEADADQQQTVGRSIRGIFSSEDYPAASLDEDQDGTVTFALLIDEAGKVADCTVIKTSGVAALDAQSCAVVKARARFKPALGANGKPAKSSMTSKVTWRIAG